MTHTSLLALAGAFALGAATAVRIQDAPTYQLEPVEAREATLSFPGAPHARLNALVGSWRMQGRWRAGPDQPWADFEAAAEREWIYGGRYVRETVTSDWEGEPFEATAYLGYDNVREEYVQVWIENASTGVQVSTGQADPSGTGIVLEGSHSNALTGEPEVWQRSELDLSKPGRTEYVGFARTAEGVEYRNLEMVAEKR